MSEKKLIKKKEIRKTIHHLISKIESLDQTEQEHINFACQWIESGCEIFRIEKPATPDTHLVSYFVIVDPNTNQVLLTDHKKSGLWLPPGGHVELNEHPSETVRREAKEELGIKAEFLIDKPIFLTVTKTVGQTAGHTDVSLWYILRGNSLQSIDFEKEEFNEVRWFKLNELPYDRTDPHLPRFIQKLKEQPGMTTFQEKNWMVYLLQTVSGKIYTGITNNLERRLEAHQKQKGGARFFRMSSPDKIVRIEYFEDRSEATKREIAIKKMKRSEKLELIGNK